MCSTILPTTTQPSPPRVGKSHVYRETPSFAGGPGEKTRGKECLTSGILSIRLKEQMKEKLPLKLHYISSFPGPLTVVSCDPERSFQRNQGSKIQVLTWSSERSPYKETNCVNTLPILPLYPPSMPYLL